MTDTQSWLVVTPARNESERLPRLAASLAAQSVQPIALWIVVDDGSDDDTATCIDPSTLPFRLEVLARTNSGGLLGASERAAFAAGVEAGMSRLDRVDRILKLDADLELAPDHFERVLRSAPDAGLVGGIIVDPGLHSQPHHVRGGLRGYSLEAWRVASEVPTALGWDVLDVVAIRAAGLGVAVVPDATATTARKTGSSEGVLQGRVRAGVVARWTGYHPAYLALRVARYSAKRPYLVGGCALLWGYAKAGYGPFSRELKKANRVAQLERMSALLRHPFRWARENLKEAG